MPELGGHQQQVVRWQCKLSVLSALLFLAQCWRRRLLEHSCDWRLEPQCEAAVRRRCALTAIACGGACRRARSSARCVDNVAAVSATATAGSSATAPTLSPPGGMAARRAQPRSLHGAWPARPGNMCCAARICAMPRGVVRNALQHSRIAAQTATTARKTIFFGSRLRRRARPWRPSRAQICTVAVRSTFTTPLGASGTQSAASSTGTRTGAARATRSRSRCAPVRPHAPHRRRNASVIGIADMQYMPHRVGLGYSLFRRQSGTRFLRSTWALCD